MAHSTTREHGWFVRQTRPAAAAATLLYVHGLGESGLCFEGLLDDPALAELRQVVPDLPGYGRSEPPGHPPSIDGTVEDLATFWRRRAEGAAIVVGHSLGGVIAQRLAERHAELVSAVIDIDGNKSEADAVFSGRAAAEPLETFVESGFDRLREAVRAAGAADPAQQGYHRSLVLADARVFHRHALDLVALSRGEDLARQLATLPMPVFYVAGSPGGASPRSLELVREAGIPTIAIAPAGHWPFLDHPRLFALLLRELVSHVLRAAPP